FVAYHEGQAAVLEFHMRPDQQVFVDPRLEVSPKDALKQYYDLSAAMATHEPAWPERLRQLPQPFGMLVNHASHHAVEAALLANHDWRCVWFDAVAGVYIPVGQDPPGGQAAVDFGARYFGREAGARRPSIPQAEAFFNVGRDLLTSPSP